jgi:cellobiose phosphorylase
MQYGTFDDKHKEYVITSPDTPKPRTNYLGSTEYGAIITNNAGGYSFYKSGGMGRFVRFRFNSIPTDQPGRYVYFHDHGTRDFWSASWQPDTNKSDLPPLIRMLWNYGFLTYRSGGE